MEENFFKKPTNEAVIQETIVNAGEEKGSGDRCTHRIDLFGQVSVVWT